MLKDHSPVKNGKQIKKIYHHFDKTYASAYVPCIKHIRKFLINSINLHSISNETVEGHVISFRSGSVVSHSNKFVSNSPFYVFHFDFGRQLFLSRQNAFQMKVVEESSHHFFQKVSSFVGANRFAPVPAPRRMGYETPTPNPSRKLPSCHTRQRGYKDY